MTTVHDLFISLLSEDPDKILIIGNNGLSVSRNDVYFKADRLARAMLAIGLTKGDGVCIQLGSTVDAIIAKLACWFAGFPVFMFGATPNPEYRKTVFDGLGAKYLLDPIRYKALMDGRFGLANSIDYPTEDDVLSQRRTSATTGVSKIVLDRCKQRMIMAKLHVDSFGLVSHDRIMIIGGQNIGTSNSIILMSLMVGSQIILYDIDREHFKEVIEANHPTYVFLPPDKNFGSSYDEFITQLKSTDMSSVKGGLMFGGVPYNYAKAIDECLPNGGLSLGYGMTELSISFYCLFDDPLEKRLTTYGRNIDPNIVRIHNGELQVIQSCTSAYLNEEQYINRITEDGWFRTGDSVHLDEDGYLCFDRRIVSD